MTPTRASKREESSGLQPLQQRPSERVLEYLLAEFDRPDLKDGVRLPTVRQFAERLKVSPPTVHAVLQRLAKQGRIRMQVGSGTYLVAAEKTVPETLNIALSMSIPEGATGQYWCHRIAAGIVLAMYQSKRRVRLVPLPRDVTSVEATRRALMEERSQVNALVVVSEPQEQKEVRQAYESAGKPVVDVNPPVDQALINFVSTDYYGSAAALGRVWKTTGRKRVIYLSNHFDESVSLRLSAAGLLTGFGAHEAGKSFRVVDARESETESVRTVLQPYLADRRSAPDAIYCAGDHQALEVLETCRAQGFNVPRDISIVGGTGLGLDNTTCPQLTRLQQPFDQIGMEVIALVCQRIEQNNATLPGRLVPTGFTGGATTRPEENELLELGKL